MTGSSLRPWPSEVLTFPHGHGQDGSPGLEAFHRAKSLGDRFSLKRSAEMLRSPADRREGGAVSRACGRKASPQAILGVGRSVLISVINLVEHSFTLALPRLCCCPCPG